MRARASPHPAVEAISRDTGLEVEWWPRRSETVFLEEDILYAVVERLVELVARPRHRHLHDVAGCGGDDSTSSRPTGQALYASRVHEEFQRLGIPLASGTIRGELHGRLVRTTDVSRRDRVEPVRRSPTPRAVARW